MGPTTPTGRRPPQSGTPCRGQHLRRRAPPQGDREERTGTVTTPAAAPTESSQPRGQDRHHRLARSSPNESSCPRDKTGAADTPAVAPPNQVRREERTGAVDTPAATGAETTNAANEPGTPHGSTPVAAVAHAADVNTPFGTTHGSKGVGPVSTTKGTGLQGPRRAPTEVTEGKGRMTLPRVKGTSRKHFLSCHPSTLNRPVHLLSLARLSRGVQYQYGCLTKPTEFRTVNDVVTAGILCVAIPRTPTARSLDAPTEVTHEDGHTGFLRFRVTVLVLIFLARRIPPFLLMDAAAELGRNPVSKH